LFYFMPRHVPHIIFYISENGHVFSRSMYEVIVYIH
jgi:hypothetical protein